MQSVNHMLNINTHTWCWEIHNHTHIHNNRLYNTNNKLDKIQDTYKWMQSHSNDFTFDNWGVKFHQVKGDEVQGQRQGQKQ